MAPHGTSIPGGNHARGAEASDTLHPSSRAAVELGVLTGFGSQGAPLVTLNGAQAAIAAASTVALNVEHLGQHVVLAFVGGDPAQPVVTGVLVHGLPAPHSDEAAHPRAWVDGDRVVVQAQRELELRCGQASITLRADGTIKTRAVNLASTATGQHRIRGASVKIN